MTYNGGKLWIPSRQRQRRSLGDRGRLRGLGADEGAGAGVRNRCPTGLLGTEAGGGELAYCRIVRAAWPGGENDTVDVRKD